MKLHEAEVAQAQGREGAAAGGSFRRERLELGVRRVGGHRGVGPQALHEGVVGGQGFRLGVRRGGGVEKMEAPPLLVPSPDGYPLQVLPCGQRSGKRRRILNRLQRRTH